MIWIVRRFNPLFLTNYFSATIWQIHFPERANLLVNRLDRLLIRAIRGQLIVKPGTNRIIVQVKFIWRLSTGKAVLKKSEEAQQTNETH